MTGLTGPSGPPRGRRRRCAEICVRRSDLLRILNTVERVYEVAVVLADEGEVDFEDLDLRPAVVILRGLVRADAS
jgi:hypothetical protein